MWETGRKNVPAVEELTPLHRASICSQLLSSGDQYTKNEEPGKVALMKKNSFEWN